MGSRGDNLDSQMASGVGDEVSLMGRRPWPMGSDTVSRYIGLELRHVGGHTAGATENHLGWGKVLHSWYQKDFSVVPG